MPNKQLFSFAARRSRAFSLIEIMVVVVIIGMLAGAVALSVGGFLSDAERSRVNSDLATLVDGIEAYYLKNRRYPTNEEGLSVLNLKNNNNKDPWGRPYEYNSPGQEGPYEVFTLGADGREGGEDENADIYSWQIGQDGAGV